MGFEPTNVRGIRTLDLGLQNQSKVTKAEAVCAKSLSSPSNPSTLVPADLLEVIKAWADLPSDTKAAVLSLVRGATVMKGKR